MIAESSAFRLPRVSAVTARPLVSVITATYNGEDFVAETIESVLAQTYAPIEHVLVDDASTDATPQILEEYAARHPDRIRVVKRNERAGPCRRRNEALEEARGEFVAWLDHDDVWLPEKIERQAEVLERQPDVGFVYTQWELFEHETGRVLERSQISPDGDTLERLVVEGCFVASSTVLWRREAMERRGIRLRETDFSWGDDHTLWLELALDRRGALVDAVLTRLRRHGANESARLALENPYPRSIELVDEFLEAHPEAAGRLAAARRRGVARHLALAAIHELGRGHRWRAGVFALRAAALNPAGAVRYARWRLGRRRRALRRSSVQVQRDAQRGP
jgi:teichuronic acid biosynthesis glycosyltransferase TuaG